ncbi:hypothetical protein CHS0354_023275 [Potamilus streckersoni]|uniref:Uncharacterized protein n=1 Tax=Potamilus streckersoni TaxID=2493646 RepID=A0AAE0T556_9BIVA|nr:hypothetical protein CHS0354_023275 [Potamilus streckersoni]
MLCACNSQPPETGTVTDIDRVITEYAWKELKRDSRWYNCLRRADFLVEVPWNFFEFEHKTVKFTPRTHHNVDGYQERKQVELFRTDFTNNTGKDQVYKLRTNRQTRARTNVTIQRGYTFKGNTNFRLTIPSNIGNFGVSASADGYLRVTQSRGETFEEVFDWQVDSDVTVEPNHATHAKLMVTEEELIADFEVKTTMFMPTGETPIIVKRKSNMEIYAVLIISNLSEIFSSIENCQVSIIKDPDTKRPRHVIEFVTTGIIESVRWRNQRICLESRPISDCDKASIPREASSNEDVPVYSSTIVSKVIEHATKENEGREKVEEQKFKEQLRIRKDLRFNVIPTIITEVDEENYESPDSSHPKSIIDVIEMEKRNVAEGEGKIVTKVDYDTKDILSDVLCKPFEAIILKPDKYLERTPNVQEDFPELDTEVDQSDEKRISKVTSV